MKQKVIRNLSKEENSWVENYEEYMKKDNDKVRINSSLFIFIRTYIACFAIFGAFGNSLLAQGDGWDFELHWPSSNPYYDSFFINQNLGWLVGQKGTLIKRMSSGYQWQSVDTYEDLNDVFFVDNINGYVVGGGGTILRTNDGGNNWSLVTLTSSTDLRGVHAMTTNEAIAVGPVDTLYKTQNGSSWEPIILNFGQSFRRIQFIDNLIGYAVGSNGAVIKSTDGGGSWSLLNTGITSNLLNLKFKNALEGWVVGSNGTALKTVNGGVSWQQVGSFPVSDVISSVELTNSNVVYIGKSNGTYSKNIGGNIWENFQIGEYNSTFTSIHVLSGAMILTSDIGGIFTSYNGGDNWVIVEPNFDFSARALCTIGNTHSWLGWDYGKIMRSINNQSWTSHNTGFSEWVKDIHFVTTEVGWYVSHNGAIRKSVDGGLTWTAQTSGTQENLNAISFYNLTTGWAVGENETILKTTDGGLTWVAQDGGFSIGDINAVYIIDEQTVYTVGGLVLKTTNGGNTWEFQTGGVGFDFDKGCFLNEQIGWVVGANQQIKKTIDGGENWIDQPQVGNSASMNINDIFFINENIGIVVSGSNINQQVFKTTNGGLTWELQTIKCSLSFFEIGHYQNGNLLIAGAGGTVMSSTNFWSDITGLVEDQDNPISVYPNPSSEMLTVQVDDEILNATIYNVLGNEVMHFKRKNINISSLSEGSYIIQIQTAKKLKSVRFLKM